MIHVLTFLDTKKENTGLWDEWLEIFLTQYVGHSVGQFVKALGYKPVGRGFSSRGVTGNFHWHNPQRHYGPGVDSASNRNAYQIYLVGGKATGT
jgi:hypothetical protein